MKQDRPNQPWLADIVSGILTIAVGAVLTLGILRRGAPRRSLMRDHGENPVAARQVPSRLIERHVSENDAEHARFIAIWSKAVDTQMHFNEMSVKSRQLGLTFVAAALGTGLVLLSRGEDFAVSLDIGNFPLQLHISVVLTAAAILGLAAVRTLDLSVYHRMLRGAVTFGEDFEEQYMRKIFQLNKGMTQAISHYSRFEDASAADCADGKRYEGEVKKSAEDKIRDFYDRTIRFLWIAAGALFLLSNAPAWIDAATGGKPNPSEIQVESQEGIPE